MKRLNRFDKRVLALLSITSRPLSGYEITKVTRLGTRLYPTLARLGDGGLIDRVRDAEPIPGTELHRYRYSLSAQARATLTDEEVRTTLLDDDPARRW